MRPASIGLVLLGTSESLLLGPVIYLAVRKFGLRGYWSHNPFEAVPEWAAPWVRAAQIVLIVGCAVGAIFYT